MVRIIITFVFALMVSATAWAGNWNSSSSPNKSKTDEIFMLPPEINLAFNKLDLGVKALHCGHIRGRTLGQLISLSAAEPPRKIEGYNSRMDNRDGVIGAPESDLFFLRLAEASTSAVFADDKVAGEIALDAMYHWAKNKALTETKKCYSSSTSEVAKNCGQGWKRKDGQDPDPTKDSGKVQAYVTHASYAYFGGLEKIGQDGEQHNEIKGWLKTFEVRNKKPSNPYFGYDFGWHWPAIFKNRHKTGNCFSGECPKKLLKKLIQELDKKLVLQDGSLKDRTTRGDRALHYHNEAMSEVIITLELARKFGVAIPKSLNERIEKAGNIFINGFFDHSYMDKWAKVAHNAQYTPGKQRFQKDLNKLSYGTSWYFIFAYRYPESVLAKKINQLFMTGTRAAKRDLALGIGLGCVYRALSENQ